LTASTSVNAKSEIAATKSAVANTNTTIERNDNKLPDGKASPTFLKTETSPIEGRRFLRQYQNLFRGRTVSGEAPPIVWGRDMKIARDLLKMYSFERLLTLLNLYFSSSDAWFEKCGYSLTCFKNAIPKLLIREGRSDSSSQFSPRNPTARLSSGWHKADDINRPSSQ
jgi:hypothetical protein